MFSTGTIHNMKFISIFILLLVMGMTAGCDNKPISQNLYLKFVELEPDTDPANLRVIVTADYLRMDDGEGSSNYILFDRKQQIVYSIARDTRQIISITKQEQKDVTAPFDLKLAEAKLDDMPNVPLVGGKKPDHFQFKAGDKVCFETLSVKDMLPAYVQAMQEYNEVLANDSMVTLTNIPADLHEGCDLAKHTYAPNRHFKHGLPVMFWNEAGINISLVDYKEDYQADKLLFELPKDFQQFNITELRSRGPAM